MQQKWKRVAKAAQISYNKFAKVVKQPRQNFHFLTSKRYSKERKLLKKLCELFPNNTIEMHLPLYRNNIKFDEKELFFRILINKTLFDHKVYYRKIKVSYYPVFKEVWISFQTEEHFRIISFTYKNVKDFNKIAKKILKNINNITFTSATNY